MNAVRHTKSQYKLDERQKRLAPRWKVRRKPETHGSRLSAGTFPAQIDTTKPPIPSRGDDGHPGPHDRVSALRRGRTRTQHAMAPYRPRRVHSRYRRDPPACRRPDPQAKGVRETRRLGRQRPREEYRMPRWRNRWIPGRERVRNPDQPLPSEAPAWVRLPWCRNQLETIRHSLHQQINSNPATKTTRTGVPQPGLSEG
jgi:hypothetical protein